MGRAEALIALRQALSAVPELELLVNRRSFSVIPGMPSSTPPS